MIKKLVLLVAGLFSIGIGSQAQAQSESYIALEVNSGRVLYSYNVEKIRPVSGLSQVATALVTLDWITRANVQLNQIITVPNSVRGNLGSNPMRLVSGDRLTLRDALYSTLLGSDNAASMTIAHFVGTHLKQRRASSANPIEEFINEMNALAGALGMTNTNFRAPHGLDANQVSESTAADMALLGVYAMRNDAFAFIVSQKSRRIGVETAGGTKYYDVKNTNPLLTDPGVDGIKTGKSNAAGACAMIGARRDTIKKVIPTTGQEQNFHQRMVVVVLGTDERYSRSRELIREGWKSFDTWLARGMPKEDGQKRFLFLRNSK